MQLKPSPPAFTLMAIGHPKTGKTSFLTTLLLTSCLGSPLINEDGTSRIPSQIATFRDLGSHIERTLAITESSSTISSPENEKITLNLIDTPGLSEGEQLIYFCRR